MFTSVISSMTGTLSIESAILCTLVSLALGMVIAVSYMAQGTFTKNFIVTLVLLPALVQTVIMIVNGNLGTSVAVMGAFSLVRFRSTPGSAREISGIFFAMVIGLATGMGYLTYAVLITVIVGLVMFILTKSKFAESKTVTKDLKITIPENLDYTDIFDDIFGRFTKSTILNKVKTTNLGSMYELQYSVEMLDESQEKQFIDELRCRNGNLTIICGRPVISREEL
ncbi:MAG TPA: DUF4956 domain-containing protein [Lachnospiraceae bacterium]|nr:DUF4956 domain-containing protein [Lachnospiraceae bacterium]